MFKNFKRRFSKSKSDANCEELSPEDVKPPVAPNREKSGEVFIPDSPVTIAIIGAGSRGSVYADYAKYNPWMLKVVAVNDCCDFRCQYIAEEHKIPPENVFVGDWKKMTKVPKLADAVAICTPDRYHLGPAEAFANLKYHLILEKPMSISLEECIRICEAVKRNNVICAVGHIYRHSMNVRCLKKIIDSGVLGDLISMTHVEMICYWHFAHSYVRGNWHKESTSSFSLLTKSCHDLDLMTYLMNQKCTKISSFGNLSHFKKEHKPVEAGKAKRCLECPIQDSCPYSAKKIYINQVRRGCTGWPVNVVQPKEPIDIESLTKALNTTDYGRCVYEMDNDVADHQVVNMTFENGATASFTMMAFTKGMTRKGRIFGSMGELEWADGKITVTDFRAEKTTNHNPTIEMIEPGPFQWSGHNGGDFSFCKAFVKAVSTGDRSHILTGVDQSLESHTYVFAAEESRRTGQTVDIEEFKKKYKIDTAKSN